MTILSSNLVFDFEEFTSGTFLLIREKLILVSASFPNVFLNHSQHEAVSAYFITNFNYVELVCCWRLVANRLFNIFN